MTPEISGTNGEPQYDCTDGCGASYGNEDLARLCCDQAAQAALRGRTAARRDGPGRTNTGP